MANEKHDPWELLREAREALVRAENRMMAPPHQVPDVIQRIDAALAEHESKERVEWFDYGEWGAKSSKINGFQLTVRAHPPLPGGPWHWEAPRCSGYAATKDEAKSAAIAAARGIK